MRKYAVWALLFLFLSGCSDIPDELNEGLELRSRVLKASECSFTANITADYGDKIHRFSMDCETDKLGNIAFSVTKPDTISGITGTLSGERGTLTFDDTALSFDLLAEAQLSPVSAPWVLMHGLRGGYLVSACTEDKCIRLSIDDTYDTEPLRLDIWLNSENMPEQADILYDGRRILSVHVENFQML